MNTNLSAVEKKLNLSSVSGSWLVNIESVVMILFNTMTSKLSERFGSSRILFTGICINALFNLLFAVPGVSTSYPVILVFRGLAAAGMGLMGPSQMPVNMYLVEPRKFPIAISLTSMLVPIGSIVGALIAGLVEEKIGWQYMCVIVGCISFINMICQLIFLPFDMPRNKEAKVNFLSVILIGSGVVVFLIGLLNLSGEGIVPTYAGIILFCVGIVILVMFFVYDFKWAKTKIFHRDLWNRNIILSEVIFIAVYIINFGERYFNSFHLAYNLRIQRRTIGYIVAGCGLSVFVFSPVTNVIQKFFVHRWVVRGFYATYFVFMCLNAL